MNKPRKFLCIGTEESYNCLWGDCFTVGEVYEEAPENKEDLWGFDTLCDETTLHLKYKEGRGLYVDANQFEEVL